MTFRGIVGSRLFVVLVAVFAASFFSGCDTGGPDKKVEDARIETAKNFRAYFNKVNGNYDQLSADDKAAFVKMSGGTEDKAQQMWNLMKYGPGGGASGDPVGQ